MSSPPSSSEASGQRLLPRPSLPLALAGALFIVLAIAILEPLLATVLILGLFVLIVTFSSPLVVTGILFFSVFASPFLQEYGFLPTIRGVHPTNGIIFLTALVILCHKLAVEKALIWRPTSLDLPMLLFAGLLVLDAILSSRVLDSTNAGLSRGFTYRSLINIFVFFLVSQSLSTRREVHVTLKVLLAVFFIVSMIAVYQNIQLSGMLGGQFATSARSRGIFYESGLLSNFSMAGALLSWSLFLFQKKKKGRWFYFANTVICCLAVLFSYMRATYMALAFGLVLISWIKDRRWLWLVAFAFVTFPLWAPESVINRLMYTFFSYGDVRALDESSSVRFMLWPAALYVIRTYPLLGAGHYSFVLQLSSQLAGQAGQPYNSHQLILNVAVDFGALGLFVFLFLGLSLVMEGWRLFRRAEARAFTLEAAVGLAFATAMVSLVLSYSTHALLFDSPMIPYIYGLAAVVARGRWLFLEKTETAALEPERTPHDPHR